MNLTLLIDLDETLLGNKMDTFIPAYLGALGKHIASYADPGEMTQIMLAATGQMFANNRPDCTLKQVFDQAFYPPLGLNGTQMREPIGQFYAQIFPTLQGVTKFRPEAIELVETAFARGYRVGIATNPLFPRIAITQRLEWAGLSPKKYPFALIPSYETFHFAKPNPAYFTEFLASIGWPDGPILMIGNDPDHDVRAARLMGLPVFWICGRNTDPLEGFPAPSGFGSLPDVIPWLDSVPEVDLRPDFSSPAALTAILRGSPAALGGLTAGLTEHVWHQRPQSNEWNLTEIACHLRDVECEVNLPQLRKAIGESNPLIPGIDTDAWVAERGYHSQDGPQALKDFTTARIETLTLLDELTEAGWQRSVRHAIFGPIDIKELVSIIARHDRLRVRLCYEMRET
ncbi:MAG: DinB family protein [Chloroflexota bacterium]